MDYKNTLNLPRTSFPMKANLAKNEPALLQFWREIDLSEALAQKRAPCGNYTLHDGPPYANGNIHIGHALNKILKDIIVKSKTMGGYRARYIPGWDCHGLPIEHQVDKKLGRKKAAIDKYQKRRLCRDYARQYIDIQREEFRRLGVFGEWDAPYLTMDYGYEAAIVRQLGEIMDKGLVYRGCKPVHWCSSCGTALAEAEVEYADHTSPSIYVAFRLEEKAMDALGAKNKKGAVVIWTTTPWTLPANMAVALHPDFEYVLAECERGTFVLAVALAEKCLSAMGVSEHRVLKSFKGKELEGYNCRHPFYPRDSRLILAPYVTLEQGTGCVHTAPGHGQEDYVSGIKYGLEIYNPVDEKGRFIAELPLWGGEFIFKANPGIIDRCRELGALLHKEDVSHSYPHCWRCKTPLIFRATEQWFISMEKQDLRQRALDEIERVRWLPHWGKERIYNMIANRPDWCISRQRVWGVPITVFYCEDCRKPLMDKETAEQVASLMQKEGSDVWFKEECDRLPPAGTTCPDCGCGRFRREMDILDVWFDSGVSHAAVLAGHADMNYPADLYLEGSDQHRGWFHSSLLIGVANQRRAPYKSVLTHGFVVDGKGKKMSKSTGNVIAPQKIIERNGAEILRLWVAAEDYREDVRISPEIIQRLTEAYRRIRNTCRFLLGNLADFDPSREKVPYEELSETDRWLLHKLQQLITRLNRAYENFEFHMIYHRLHNFCSVTLSAVYLDILKDRLYCSGRQSRERRSAQTVLWEALSAMVRLMAPILSFTAEEVWQSLPEGTFGEKSVHLAELPEANQEWLDEALESKWERLLACRTAAYKALETARHQKLMGSFLETQVTLYAEKELYAFLRDKEALLAEILIVSAVKVAKMADFDPGRHKIAWKGDDSLSEPIKAGVDLSNCGKCERCWNYYPSVGKNGAHPTLCERCASVMDGYQV